jgi:hypothetical protein
MLSDSKAELSVMLGQAIMYGVYLATLAHCLRWFLYDGKVSGEGSRRMTGNKRVVLATLVQVFVLDMTSVGVRLAMAIEQTLVVTLDTVNVSWRMVASMPSEQLLTSFSEGSYREHDNIVCRCCVSNFYPRK